MHDERRIEAARTASNEMIRHDDVRTGYLVAVAGHIPDTQAALKRESAPHRSISNISNALSERIVTSWLGSVNVGDDMNVPSDLCLSSIGGGCGIATE